MGVGVGGCSIALVVGQYLERVSPRVCTSLAWFPVSADDRSHHRVLTAAPGNGEPDAQALLAPNAMDPNN